MRDMPPGVPSEAAWERAGQRGEKAVRDAIGKISLRYTKQPNAHALGMAVAFGALVAAAELLRVMVDDTNETGMRKIEENALAYVRGAVRGATEPLNADGTIFVRSFDA